MAAPLTDYELQRESNIRMNNEFLESLGVEVAAQGLERVVSKRKLRRKPVPKEAAAPIGPTRRSSRVGGQGGVVYRELSEREVRLVDGPEPKRRAARASSAESRQLRRSYGPEQYTKEHEKALGSCEKEWVLFEDGYAPDGKRVYDTTSGKTCHQCRQKTLGKRTWCNSCQTLNGQFCGDCLYMRYGENILEVNANSEWTCPTCRDLCNCSICRHHKGWGPTGQLYRTAVNGGHKSVAHYLVATRRAPSAASTETPPVEESNVTENESPSAAVVAETPSAEVQPMLVSKAASETSAPSSPSGLTSVGLESPESQTGGSAVLDKPDPPLVPSAADLGGLIIESSPSVQISKPGRSIHLKRGLDLIGSFELVRKGEEKHVPSALLSRGGSSCESGLSSEDGLTPPPRDMLERKFRSLKEIQSEITGKMKPQKRSRASAGRA